MIATILNIVGFFCCVAYFVFVFAIIGVGAGRGIGLMFICLGGSMTLVAIAAYCVTAVRTIDEMEVVLPPSLEATLVGAAAGDDTLH